MSRTLTFQKRCISQLNLLIRPPIMEQKWGSLKSRFVIQQLFHWYFELCDLPKIIHVFFIVLLSKLDHWSPRPQRNNRLKDKEQRNLQFPQLWKQLHKPWFHPPSPFPIFKAQFYIILYKFCICSKSGRCLEWDLGKNEKENKFRYIKRSALSGISSSLFYKQISKCELHIKSCYLQHFLG